MLGAIIPKDKELVYFAQEKVSPSSDKNGEIQENFCK